MLHMLNLPNIECYNINWKPFKKRFPMFKELVLFFENYLRKWFAYSHNLIWSLTNCSLTLNISLLFVPSVLINISYLICLFDQDKNLSNGIFFLELLSAVQPRVVNWKSVTVGETGRANCLLLCYVANV